MEQVKVPGGLVPRLPSPKPRRELRPPESAPAPASARSRSPRKSRDDQNPTVAPVPVPVEAVPSQTVALFVEGFREDALDGWYRRRDQVIITGSPAFFSGGQGSPKLFMYKQASGRWVISPVRSGKGGEEDLLRAARQGEDRGVACQKAARGSFSSWREFYQGRWVEVKLNVEMFNFEQYEREKRRNPPSDRRRLERPVALAPPPSALAAPPSLAAPAPVAPLPDRKPDRSAEVERHERGPPRAERLPPRTTEITEKEVQKMLLAAQAETQKREKQQERLEQLEKEKAEQLKSQQAKQKAKPPQDAGASRGASSLLAAAARLHAPPEAGFIASALRQREALCEQALQELSASEASMATATPKEVPKANLKAVAPQAPRPSSREAPDALPGRQPQRPKAPLPASASPPSLLRQLAPPMPARPPMRPPPPPQPAPMMAGVPPVGVPAAFWHPSMPAWQVGPPGLLPGGPGFVSLYGMQAPPPPPPPPPPEVRAAPVTPPKSRPPAAPPAPPEVAPPAQPEVSRSVEERVHESPKADNVPIPRQRPKAKERSPESERVRSFLQRLNADKDSQQKAQEAKKTWNHWENAPAEAAPAAAAAAEKQGGDQWNQKTWQDWSPWDNWRWNNWSGDYWQGSDWKGEKVKKKDKKEDKKDKKEKKKKERELKEKQKDSPPKDVAAAGQVKIAKAAPAVSSAEASLPPAPLERPPALSEGSNASDPATAHQLPTQSQTVLSPGPDLHATVEEDAVEEAIRHVRALRKAELAAASKQADNADKAEAATTGKAVVVADLPSADALRPFPATVEGFYGFMVERERIRLRRQRGEWPWTADPILRHLRVRNVNRQHDRSHILMQRWLQDRPMRLDRVQTEFEEFLWNVCLWRRFGSLHFINKLGFLPTPSSEKDMPDLVKVATELWRSGLHACTDAYGPASRCHSLELSAWHCDPAAMVAAALEAPSVRAKRRRMSVTEDGLQKVQKAYAQLWNDRIASELWTACRACVESIFTVDPAESSNSVMNRVLSAVPKQSASNGVYAAELLEDFFALRQLTIATSVLVPLDLPTKRCLRRISEVKNAKDPPSQLLSSLCDRQKELWPAKIEEEATSKLKLQEVRAMASEFDRYLRAAEGKPTRLPFTPMM